MLCRPSKKSLTISNRTSKSSQSRKKDYQDAVKVLTEDAKSIDLQINLGHKHRSEYFKAIQKDMQRDVRLRPLFDLFGSQERLWHFICNVSNLQLRALRWYFNERNPQLAALWSDVKFQTVWVRALKYFHPEKDRRAEFQNLIREIAEAPNAFDMLCTVDPLRTIPPYEDQNNRRPPVDQTLYLNPGAMQKRYEERWRIWSQKFERDDNVLSESLETILDLADRKSRVPRFVKEMPSRDEYFDSYVLQRVLDRSSSVDKFALRALAGGSKSQRLKDCRAELARILGEQHIDEFLSFAADYYSEVEAAKNGLWIESEHSLLERSDIHPPMKKKIIDLLVGNLFDVDEQTGRKIRETLWRRPIPGAGKRTLKSICESVESVRKAFGGEFRYRYDDFLRRQLSEKNLKPSNPQEKDLLSVSKGVETARKFLSDALALSEAQESRIASPYVWAQLYTLLETERDGFTSTTLAAHMENKWRMSSNECGGAQCSRLPADAVRPFDGVLRKSLDRQAFEAAKLAAAELTLHEELQNARINFGILVESNKFAFTASLADLKKNNAALKKANLGLVNQQNLWLDKDERIIAAARGVCAYTGKTIDPKTDSTFEIDHIVPRSMTTAAMGTVFNSEANLICVSREGNQRKSDQRYYLRNLNAKYLAGVFGTSDLAQIEAKIEAEVEKLVRSRRIRYFDLLSQSEQDAVRHALFLGDESEARNCVLRELAASSRTRVNGTQAWFVRSFIQKLSALLEPWLAQKGNSLVVRSWKSDAEQSSRIRRALGAASADLVKYQPQPVASHTIDAMCAYAVLCAKPDVCAFLGGSSSFADTETYGEEQSLANLHPRNVRLINVAGRSEEQKTRHDARAIFKETIYAENFLPLLQVKDRFYVGFTLPDGQGRGGNALPVKGKEPLKLLERISAYLDRPVTQCTDRPTTYRVEKAKAYELLTKANLRPRDLTEEETQCVEILHQLLYWTQRVSVAARLRTPDGKKFAKKADVLKEADFDVKVGVGSSRMGFVAQGKLQLPAFKDWQKLADRPELDGKWESAEVFDLEGFLEKQTKMNASSLSHASHKRLVSLPVCSKPSGGFRIRRRTSDGEPVYQVQAFSNVKYLGFSADSEGKVNWKNSVVYAHLNHPNVTAIDSETSEADFVVPMNEWRTVSSHGQVLVEACPGSDARPYVRVRMSFKMLCEWLKSAKVETLPEGPMQCPQLLKLPKPELFFAAAKETLPVFAAPRDKIVFEQLGETVVFTFSGNSGLADLRNAYNLAAKV